MVAARTRSEARLPPRRPGVGGVFAGLLALLLALPAGACSAPRPDRDPAANEARGELAPEDADEAWMEEGEPEPDPVSPEYLRLGLSGVNKPEGPEYRLRRSVPSQTPLHVPREMEGLVLFIAEPTPEGWFAFYREPLERMEGARNPSFRAVLFGEDWRRRWDLDLNRFLSRPDHLEIQDIRYREGKLYFNEACQSYSREAGGNCSSLLRVDPERQQVEWRTRPRTSNDIFILHGPHVIAGYGFTAEPDSLFWIARETGEIVARRHLPSAHSYLEVQDGRLLVLTQGDRVDTLEAEPAPRR